MMIHKSLSLSGECLLCKMQRERGSEGDWGLQTVPLLFTSGLFKCLLNRISG